MQYLDEKGYFSDPAGGGAAAATTVDTLGGAGATGKALAKAATPAAALTALGITPQTKPADVAAAATNDDVIKAVNALTALLKTAGVLK